MDFLIFPLGSHSFGGWSVLKVDPPLKLSIGLYSTASRWRAFATPFFYVFEVRVSPFDVTYLLNLTLGVTTNFPKCNLPDWLLLFYSSVRDVFSPSSSIWEHCPILFHLAGKAKLSPLAPISYSPLVCTLHSPWPPILPPIFLASVQLL